jgi:hypothetical protein
MKLIYLVLLLVLAGCGDDEYARKRAAGVTWTINGFQVFANDRVYECARYSVIPARAGGYRIQMFSDWMHPNDSLSADIACSQFEIKKCRLVSRARDCLE